MFGVTSLAVNDSNFKITKRNNIIAGHTPGSGEDPEKMNEL